MKNSTTHVVVIGLGPIGTACARAVRAEGGMKLVGLVDRNTAKQGKTLEEVTGKPGAGDQDEAALKIVESIGDVVGPVDVAVVAVTSHLPVAAPLIEELIDRGVNVVSSCEEMVWPWYRHAAMAQSLHEKAQQAGVTILGTGVNPGFAMDLLPVTLASMLRRVSAVRCRRQVDAGLRRASLQRKLGITLSAERFEELKQSGDVGLVGMAESVAMIATGLGRQVKPGSVHEVLEPILAEQPRPSALGIVGEGRVAGVHQTATWEGQGLHIELVLEMATGLEDPRDVVELDGPVQIRSKIAGALPGDSATVAAVLNAIGSFRKWQPGFRTMLDVPPSCCHNQDMEPS